MSHEKVLFSVKDNIKREDIKGEFTNEKINESYHEKCKIWSSDK